MFEAGGVKQATLATDPNAQWRYAVWDSVNAEMLALENHLDDARVTFARARDALVKRYGEQSFFVLRLDQRAATLNRVAAAARKSS